MSCEIRLGQVNQKTGQIEHQPENFQFGQPLGSGFSGEVRQAFLSDGRAVAVKILRPEVAKTLLRDRLWALASGSPFPLEQNEQAAVYSLMCWHIFAQIANRSLAEELNVRVNPPIGYYYDSEARAFALVSPYVEGETGRPVVRNLFKMKEGDSYRAKIKAMESLFDLAKKIGMTDLARQFAKGTLVSPANVLQEKTGQFVAVDVTPGLCVRFPLSPYDVGVFIEDIKKGNCGQRHFLKIDFATLEKYISENPQLSDLLPAVEGAKEIAKEKSGSFADVWETRGLISLPEAEALRSQEAWPFYYWLAKYLPILELARKSNRGLLRMAWAEEELRKGKLTPELARVIASSDLRFLGHLSAEARKELVEEVIIIPGKIILGNRQFIRDWLSSIECPLPAAAPDRLQQLKADNDIRDIVATAGLEVLFKIGSVSFLMGLDTRLGLIAALLETPFLPFPLPSPSGICRAVYLNLRSLTDLPEVARTQTGKLNKLKTMAGYFSERFFWSAAASLKTIGNFILPIKLYATHPEEATAIAQYLIGETIGRIPIFGEKSGILQQYAFDLVFNLPQTLAAKITDKLRKKKV